MSRNSLFSFVIGTSILLCGVSARGQQWQPIAPMFRARVESQCIELKDGRILVAGGRDDGGAVSACEIYDPFKDKWTMTGSLNQARYRFPMCLLNDGRVLAVGGLTDLDVATTATCEIYDPTTGAWSFTASLPEPDENATAVNLQDGRIFVVNGLDAPVHRYIKAALIYDPSTGTFTRLPDCSIARDGVQVYYHREDSTLIVSGGVFDGFYGFYPRTTELYSFKTNAWSVADSSVQPHDNGQWLDIEMPDGTPLMISGRTGPTTLSPYIEAYDWNTSSWSQIGQLADIHWHCSAYLIGNDSIIVIGGSTPEATNITNSVTWFRYSDRKSWAGPNMITARASYSGLYYTFPSQSCGDSSCVFVFGGADSANHALAACEKLPVEASAFTPSFLHRSAASAYSNQVDSLPMVVDVNAQVNLDSLWPTLTEIQGTYAWDSSVVSFAGYEPPAGWVLNALTNHRNSLDFDIQNNSSAATHPLDLGTALFKPHTTELATSWVTLPVLTLTAGGDVLSLCTSQNEDSHWSVKTLGEPSAVSASPLPLSPLGEGCVWPNPAGNEIFVKNPGAAAHITLYDALGREVAQMELSAASTSTLDIHALAAGVYFVRISTDGGAFEQAIVKE